IVATESVAEFRNGLLAADGQNRFVAANMTTSLQDFIEVVVGWMRQYEFDPSAVELAFGQDGDALPPWNIDLGEGKQLLLRGKIDRVDLCRNVGDRRAACVVIDYKSSAKKLHPILLTNGIQLQLLAYLNALHGIPEARQLFDLDNLVPAGVFYVNLRGQYQKRRTRRQILAAVGDARRMAYRHNG